MTSLQAATVGTGRHQLINTNLVEVVDEAREASFGKLTAAERSQKGQFGTPSSVAKLMASMFTFQGGDVRLLDAGAGVGSLTAAFVEAACRAKNRPSSIQVVAFEIEPALVNELGRTLKQCERHCERAGVRFTADIRNSDFIEVMAQRDGLFGTPDLGLFDCAIQNPPYRKIRSNSSHRALLRQVGIETSNMYSAFVALTLRLLRPGGRLVAITPRSFCNGPYFKDFRRDFLRRMKLDRIHVFDSRTEAFGGDKVLQENIIVSATASATPPGQNDTVLVTSSSGIPGGAELRRTVSYDVVVPPDRVVPFIHLITDGAAEGLVARMGRFDHTLADLGLKISTGRVVDFRARHLLRKEFEPGGYPLIYPVHLREGWTRWPVPDAKKANGLAEGKGVEKLLVPPGLYVVLKRFSSKEQRRRLSASIYDSDAVAPGLSIGFENHLNYLHERGSGLPAELVRGLAAYLNSSLADQYFRLFSGHTQVNATDMRGFPFPGRDDLVRLGEAVGSMVADQKIVDDNMSALFMDGTQEGEDPVKQQQRQAEAQAVLKALGFPKAQYNERSALTLLALLGLGPDTPWDSASNPMLGITPMMGIFAEQYGKEYAPNSRETVRRCTIHQFLDAGLIAQNPDDPARPVNSGKNVYQIVPEALAMLKTVGSAAWEGAKTDYLARVGGLKEQYAQRRAMERIPVQFNDGQELSLSPGGQNVLVKEIIGEFIPRFAPKSTVIYVGDTEDKWAFFDEQRFADLGVQFDTHGKFPDVIVHYTEKNWLLLVEAVTSHGPVDPKRLGELKTLFKGCTAGLVYVTTFLTRKDLNKYLAEIAWETEVWVADSPGHMIHFDGKRFLGPYED